MTRKTWAAGFLVLLMSFAMVLVALHWRENDTVQYYEYAVNPIKEVQPVGWPNGTVNVNTADETALQALQGIRQSQIEALLEDREKNGAYDFPEDLIYVKGIGEKTLYKIYSQLDFAWRAGEN